MAPPARWAISSPILRLLQQPPGDILHRPPADQRQPAAVQLAFHQGGGLFRPDVLGFGQTVHQIGSRSAPAFIRHGHGVECRPEVLGTTEAHQQPPAPALRHVDGVEQGAQQPRISRHDTR